MSTGTIFAPPMEVMLERWPFNPMVVNISNIPNYHSEDAGKYTAELILPIMFVAVVLVGLRLVARAIKKTMGLDDILVVLAVTPMIAVVVLMFKLRDYGIGLHMWDAISLRKMDLIKAQDARMTIFLVTILLSVSHILARVSILTFLYRIFNHGGEKKMRMALHATTFFIISTSFVIFFADIFQCLPVQAYWDAKIVDAKCGQQRPLLIVGKMFNCVGNVVLFALPLNRLWKIQVPLAQRIGLVFAFGLGLGICVLSLTKMIYLGRLLYHNPLYDLTWFYYPVAIICTWENCLTIICSCIPMLGFYFSLPMFSTSKKSTKQSSQSSNPSASGSRSEPSSLPASTRSSWNLKYWSQSNSCWSDDSTGSKETIQKSKWLVPPNANSVSRSSSRSSTNSTPSDKAPGAAEWV